MSTFSSTGADLDSMVCTCGHTAHWHSQQGKGDCDYHSDCGCKKFQLMRVDTLGTLRRRIAELTMPPADSPRRYMVMVCDGCEDCEPTDGSAPSKMPCTWSMSVTGREMVLAEDYDTMVRINAERERELRRVHGDAGGSLVPVEAHLIDPQAHGQPGHMPNGACPECIKELQL